MTPLLIVVPGRPVSNNAVARASGGRVHKGARAAEYQYHANLVARERAEAVGWVIPECARVSILLCNSWIDADNAQKLAVDALKGVVIVDDNRRHMRGIAVEHAIDGDGPRVEITVTPCEPLDSKPARKPKASAPRASFAETQAEARRRTAAKPRTLDEMKSGDVLNFADRDALLREVGVAKSARKR